MITKKIRLKVYKYTEDGTTNYRLETNDFKVGYVHNFGEGRVQGVYDVRERGVVDRICVEHAMEFVENGIKEQFEKFGFEVEFVDFNEMFNV